MSLASVKVRPYTWDQGKPSAVPGVKICAGPGFAFVPTSQLRQIADQLHDHADQLEDQEAGQ